MAELESFCNKVCIIKNGIIVENSSLDSVKKDASSGNYTIEVDNPNRAKILLGDIAEIIDDTHISVSSNRQNVSEIVKKLVLQDIKIYSLQEKIVTLEDAFLKKTGGNVID